MKKIDFFLVLTLFVIICIIAIWQSTIAILIAFFLMMILLFYSYRNLEIKLKTIKEKNKFNYQQLESLFSLYNVLAIRHPLANFRNWAISPDFANLLIQTILEKKPNVILETGSGISTIISAYCLEQMGKGKILSLDHLQEYANNTKKMISQHGLQNFTNISFAPLKEYKIDNQNWLCYDFKTDLKIDLLIIDGPPANTQKNARFPVLPLFYDNLNDNAVIILDDAVRNDEKEIVKMWLSLYDDLESEYIELEKGAIIITKKK